ncbi:hypothetical protein M422DRAFT_37604 [Sphaerobolus stellatus SS14]|uniref:Uncharacterized protein n=1 Tax=Sphaerobolus stellatus (strain SS14) TaxID=990650 RepID=A0A0C9U170_SPHS4|nr:hypothetical protein M422DRAFT_37604 [Sphaerobolus stellatus SS14]
MGGECCCRVSRDFLDVATVLGGPNSLVTAALLAASLEILLLYPGCGIKNGRIPPLSESSSSIFNLFCLLRKKINVATINPRRATAEAAIPTIAPTEIPPSPGEDELGLSPCVAVLELGELVDVPVEPI